MEVREGKSYNRTNKINHMIEQRTLHLTLKKKWFDMILSGEKKEEYREFKHYWVSRLSVKYPGAVGGDFMSKHKDIAYRWKEFDIIMFTNGYSKHAPKIYVECKGISDGICKPEWSDNAQGTHIVIMLGKVMVGTIALSVLNMLIRKDFFVSEHASNKVHIRSGQWGAWWRPNCRGYTTDIQEAGIYTFKEALEASGHCSIEKKIHYEFIK